VQLAFSAEDQRVLAVAIAAAAGAVALAVGLASFGAARSGIARSQPLQAYAVRAAPARGPAVAPLSASATTQSADRPLRITGTVGPDLSQSLKAAGIPEQQGRAYVAALASAIDLRTGLSVADRFDLIIERENGKLGELVYAGLARVGRNDVELMKWTQGRTTRWVDAQTLGAEQGMELPVAGRVSSGFGERFHPILHTMRMHDGVDLAAPWGTPIVAAADGRVISAGWRGGYGRAVEIAHAGNLETLYGHMSRIAAEPGEAVRQGQVIGYVGASGLATGPHLHYEVHKEGRLVNPLSVNMVSSPIQGEELHAFDAKLRSLLTGNNAS
jgi:murein DD-endopeptidase MepM/ murein hydrolase activator NlpD